MKTIKTEIEVDVALDDFDDDEIREEFHCRFGEDAGQPNRAEELADLIAEAARVSIHARKAYQILRDEDHTLHALDVRQRIIAGRMGEAA